MSEAHPNPILKSRAKVAAHHAIIPTEKIMDLSLLSAKERSVYALIAHQYLAQFYPLIEGCKSLFKADVKDEPETEDKTGFGCI